MFVLQENKAFQADVVFAFRILLAVAGPVLKNVAERTRGHYTKRQKSYGCDSAWQVFVCTNVPLRTCLVRCTCRIASHAESRRRISSRWLSSSSASEIDFPAVSTTICGVDHGSNGRSVTACQVRGGMPSRSDGRFSTRLWCSTKLEQTTSTSTRATCAFCAISIQELRVIRSALTESATTMRPMLKFSSASL